MCGYDELYSVFHSTCRYKIEPPGFWRTAVVDLMAQFAYNAIMTQFWPSWWGRSCAFHKLIPRASSPLTYSVKKGLNRTVTLSLQVKKKISIIRRRILIDHYLFIINVFFKVHRKYFLSFMVLLQESGSSLLTLSRQHLNKA